MKKSFIILLVILLLLSIAYYLVSPIFNVVELNEDIPYPLEVNDALNTMDSDTKSKFEKETNSMKGLITIMDDKMPLSSSVHQGEFKPRAHEVEGEALVIESGGKRILRLENFDTINGPNLHLYLSTELGDSDFIDLGKLKATKGNINYILPDDVDLSKYNKVLIWCVPFSVLFSYAELI
jgi:hypothetical protein